MDDNDNKPTSTQQWLWRSGCAVAALGLALAIGYSMFADWCAASDCF